MDEVTAINVLIEYQGKQHIAFIDPVMKDLFIGMLGTYQSGQPKNARLYPLPPRAAKNLINMRHALLDHFETTQPAPKEAP